MARSGETSYHTVTVVCIRDSVVGFVNNVLLANMFAGCVEAYVCVGVCLVCNVVSVTI